MSDGPRAKQESGPPLSRAERENLWWRSIIGDAIYALRHQDDLSREDIATALANSLEHGPPNV